MPERCPHVQKPSASRSDGEDVARNLPTDPRDTVGLRWAMQKRVPLVYCHGVVPGRYLATWPVYIVADDAAALMFTVALDAHRRACALCRLRHRELLDAAHILPDTDARSTTAVSHGARPPNAASGSGQRREAATDLASGPGRLVASKAGQLRNPEGALDRLAQSAAGTVDEHAAEPSEVSDERSHPFPGNERSAT